MPPALEDRPMSAMQRAVEDKVFSLQLARSNEESDSDGEEEEEEVGLGGDDHYSLLKDMVRV